MNQLQAAFLNNRISIDELMSLYGNEYEKWYLAFAHDRTAIEHPLSYKLLVRFILHSLLCSQQKERYKNALTTYNKTINKHFKEWIEAVKWLQRETLRSPLDIFRMVSFDLHDEYNWFFKDGTFRRERDLEYVIYDNFFWFDFNDEIQVYRQEKTPAGPVDIKLVHDNTAMLMELKTGKASRKHVFQVLDYYKTYELQESETCKVPILVANHFDDYVLEVAREYNVGCYQYEIVSELPYTSIVLEPKAPNKVFDRFFDYYSYETDCYISSQLPTIITDFEEFKAKAFADQQKEIDTIKNALLAFGHIT